MIPVFGSMPCVITFIFCVFNLTIAISFNQTRDNQCIVNNKSIKLDALTLLILGEIYIHDTIIIHFKVYTAK